MTPNDRKLDHQGEWSEDEVRHEIRLLNTVISQRGGLRPHHLFADLALAVLAHHVSEYANATLTVLESDVPGTVYPLLRAAFETQLDVVYLTTSGPDFSINGARAYVAARVSDYGFVGLQRRAAKLLKIPWQDSGTLTLKETLRRDAEAWERAAPGQGQLIWDAFKLVRAARKSGKKHWTGLSRMQLHTTIEQRLQEPAVEALFRSLYDQMASRSHSGMRLGPYIQSVDGGVKVASKPDFPDPFPLQRLGDILHTTTSALARFYVQHPHRSPQAPP